MARGILVALIVVAILAGAAYGLSPFWAVRELRAAAQSGDQDELEQVVDFTAVRKNLKEQLPALVTQWARKDPSIRDNPFANLGLLLAPALIDRAVDSQITPAGISTLMTQGRLTSDSSQSSASGPGASPALSYGYRTLDRFRVQLRAAGQPDPLSLILERRGLFSWKLIRVDLPPSLFEPAQSLAARAPERKPARKHSEARAEPDGRGCWARALARVPSVQDPATVLESGAIQEGITQYVIDQQSGVKSYCSHGGYCYQRFLQGQGREVEVLKLGNCHVGSRVSDEYGSTIYSVDLTPSQNSAATMRYAHATEELGKLGLCSACAGNAALYYVEEPDSDCGRLVSKALAGDEEARSELNSESSEQCWQH